MGYYNGYTSQTPNGVIQFSGFLGSLGFALSVFFQSSSARNLHRNVEEFFLSEVPHTNVVSGEKMAVMISCIFVYYIYIYI